MFTYVMKGRIEELIEEELNQEFPEEVETKENQDFESDEEMTSETEETDDDSEPNNENVNNYLDSANMAMNLESAMKIAEEEDLWIGDSGASSHMMGSEEHVVNKKLISGSVRTANGAHMKMLCEEDINVDVITKNGDESYTRNEAEAFWLHTSNVGWLVHARWSNKTRRAFYSSDP